MWKFQESYECLQIRNGAAALVVIINQVLLSYRLSYDNMCELLYHKQSEQLDRQPWKEVDCLISCLGEQWCKPEGEIHNLQYSAVHEPWGHSKAWCSWGMIVPCAGTPKERWNFSEYMIMLNRFTLWSPSRSMGISLLNPMHSIPIIKSTKQLKIKQAFPFRVWLWYFSTHLLILIDRQ